MSKSIQGVEVDTPTSTHLSFDKLISITKLSQTIRALYFQRKPYLLDEIAPSIVDKRKSRNKFSFDLNWSHVSHNSNFFE